MNFNYQRVKQISDLLEEARINIINSRKLGTVDTKNLDKVIEELDELISLEIKLADFDELSSDIEWLEEYYEQKSWSDATRWLSNIDGTLREAFSQYTQKLKEKRASYSKNKTNYTKER